MDRYTKVILTIIAFALCVLAIENFESAAAQAQSGVTKVAICDNSGLSCAEILDSKLLIFATC
jgi:hypothetical protein